MGLEVLPRLTDGGYDLVLRRHRARPTTPATSTRPCGCCAPAACWRGRRARGGGARPRRRRRATLALREVTRLVRADERLAPTLLPLGRACSPRPDLTTADRHTRCGRCACASGSLSADHADAGADLGHDVSGPLDKVVAGGPRPTQPARTSACPCGGRSRSGPGRLPGPAVDLDGHLGLREREVDQVGPERVAELPPADPGRARQPDHHPVQRPVGAVRRRGQQRSRRIPAADRPAVAGRPRRTARAAGVRDPGTPTVGQRDRRLQHGERATGEPQPAHHGDVLVGQVSAAQPRTGACAAVYGAGRRRVDDSGCRSRHLVQRAAARPARPPARLPTATPPPCGRRRSAWPPTRTTPGYRRRQRPSRTRRCPGRRMAVRRSLSERQQPCWRRPPPRGHDPSLRPTPGSAGP